MEDAHPQLHASQEVRSAHPSLTFILSARHAGAEHLSDLLGLETQWLTIDVDGLGTALGALDALSVRDRTTNNTAWPPNPHAQVLSALLSDGGGQTPNRIVSGADLIYQAERLREVWPDAKFICLHRSCLASISNLLATHYLGYAHADDVARYISRMPRHFVHALALYWVELGEVLEAFERAHSNVCFALRYEDLLDVGLASMTALRSFLGLSDRSASHRRLANQEAQPTLSSALPLGTLSSNGCTLPTETIPIQLRKRIDRLNTRLGYETLRETDERLDQSQRRAELWSIAGRVVRVPSRDIAAGAEQASLSDRGHRESALLASAFQARLRKGPSPECQARGERIRITVTDAAVALVVDYATGHVFSDDMSAELCVASSDFLTWRGILLGVCDVRLMIIQGRLRIRVPRSIEENIKGALLARHVDALAAIGDIGAKLSWD